jgi:hypothetical protein
VAAAALTGRIAGSAAYAAMSEAAQVGTFNRRMDLTVQRIVPGDHWLAHGFYVAVGCGVALLGLAVVQFQAVGFRHPRSPAGQSWEAEQAAPADRPRE